MKYELTDQTLQWKGRTLRRIRALKGIACYGVAAGDLGGYVEREDNLSQQGDCWVADDAKVYGLARVDQAAYVCGEAEVSEWATVTGFAVAGDGATISGNAVLRDHAAAAWDAQIDGYAQVDGYAHVATRLSGIAYVGELAEITSPGDCITVTGLGERGYPMSFSKDRMFDIAACGQIVTSDDVEYFFTGTVEELELEVGEQWPEYRAAIDCVRKCWREGECPE